MFGIWGLKAEATMPLCSSHNDVCGSGVGVLTYAESLRRHVSQKKITDSGRFLLSLDSFGVCRM